MLSPLPESHMREEFITHINCAHAQINAESDQKKKSLQWRQSIQHISMYMYIYVYGLFTRTTTHLIRAFA
jgi:hypothetical protein